MQWMWRYQEEADVDTGKVVVPRKSLKAIHIWEKWQHSLEITDNNSTQQRKVSLEVGENARLYREDGQFVCENSLRT